MPKHSLDLEAYKLSMSSGKSVAYSTGEFGWDLLNLYDFQTEHDMELNLTSILLQHWTIRISRGWKINIDRSPWQADHIS